MRQRILFLCACLLLSFVYVNAANWNQWRGPNANGTSDEKDLPLRWSAKENVAWKLEMPDLSGSTPIIWGDKIFLNIADGKDIFLWCVDKKKGTPLWKQKLGDGNHIERKQNMSSPSPVTDGSSVYVMTGTGVLKGFDFEGKELWFRDIQKEYGAFGLNYGYASSPLLFEDALYVQILHGAKTDRSSYVLKIDKKTGKTLWKVERKTEAENESPDSYTTPALLLNGKSAEIVITGGDYVTGHDPLNGKELWRAGGMNPDNDPFYRTIASPIITDGMIYVPTKVKPFQAFRAGGRGNITKSHFAWSLAYGPDVPTPATDGKFLYIVHDKGIVWALDAKTGKEFYAWKRIASSSYSASPVLADGKLYVISEDGLTTVIKAGGEFEVLAENALEEYTLSSLAISDGQIFVRTTKHLYCIGKK